MKKVHFTIISLAAVFILFAAGCSKSNNPVSASATSNLSGKWKIQYYGSDTLLVNLNLSSTNNNLSGSYDASYSSNSNGVEESSQSTGTISGTYTDNSISITGTNAFGGVVGDLGNISFNGNKDGANYKGTATYIFVSGFSLNPDTLKFSNATMTTAN